MFQGELLKDELLLRIGILRFTLILFLIHFCVACATTNSMSPKMEIIKHPASEVDVFYAGFAYQGDFKDIKLNFPFTSKANTLASDGTPTIDHHLRQYVKELKPRHFKLHTKRLANMDDGEYLTTAMVLDNETISVEKIGAQYKLLVSLSFQALFFSYDTLSVVGSYPIIFEYVELMQRKPNQEIKQRMVRQIFNDTFETSDGVGLYEELANRLLEMRVNPDPGRLLQVTEITVDEKNNRVLPSKLRQSRRLLETLVANTFSQHLASNQQIPVLPYTKGYAIGNKMAASFVNGEVYDLEIPDADFHIELRLNEFKKINVATTSLGSKWLYGTNLNIKVHQPDLGKVYMDSRIKKGVFKTVPASQKIVDDWAAFHASMIVLMDEFTTQLDHPGRAWAKGHSRNTNLKAEMRAFDQLIESCK
ncbi:MAG: hypothetical protein KUG82_16650 [Pseudomonadales bacterium]|nr:hypothetical protein [Pseudomonadales bacterium]